LGFYLELLLRLLLAGVLGGAIGYEREHTNRPAGFRTHILVCVGSALVMVTSEFIFNRYNAVANIDPARLGAQVISGIGFLGAGTIIRYGFNVKGLTTAASLWAVSCVGIAAGIGFYEGAVIATALIFLTLIFLKKAEIRFAEKTHLKTYLIESENLPGQVGQVSGVFEKYKVEIKSMEFFYNEGGYLLLKLLVKSLDGKLNNRVVDELQRTEGVKKVMEE
jgi:putative Mg2+ transporter-C (MgtC) family protein